MIYLIAIFLPPLYFLLRKKWGGFVLNSILYFMALPTMLIGLGLVFWVSASIHATYHIRRELDAEQAERIATRTAEKMKEMENK